MALVPKLIKAAVDFGRLLPEQLVALGDAVVKGLTGNANFTNVPVDLNALKTELDAYSVSITEARDGGKKAITSRNHHGQNVIRMLRVLAAYVESNCKDDMNIFLSSGFQPRSNTRTPAQALDQPTIVKVEQGKPGELRAKIKSVRKAKHYELRHGPEGPNGSAPASWTILTVPNAKTAVPLDGLTAGTTYAIQVRAYGQLGYTAWSDSVTRMVI
jgi:hypothetical protein